MNKTLAISFFGIVLMTILGCSLFNGVSERISNTKATVDDVATKVEQGRNLVGTAQGIATQVGESGFLETIQNLATEVDESGMLATVQAIATEQGPVILGTIQAYATQEGPALIATVQAAATEFSENQGTIPEDIPVIDSSAEQLVANSRLISYQTAIPFINVVDFYRIEMQLNEWLEQENDSFVAGKTAVLVFNKNNRAATVTLSTNPLNDHTIVLITVQSK
ncbi:MAG: hypothetical protein KAT29_04150 [Anaerolineales bacterium]|jgi:hypothetical protein|nr:hypothetical protein [Anaerolineales bacterium]